MKNHFRNNRFDYVINARKERTQASLYDLIQAVSEEVEPWEGNLIPETVQHLFESGKARFMDGSIGTDNSF